MLRALINGTIYTGEKKTRGKAVIIRDDLIESIVDNRFIPAKAEITDCRDKIISPGLIDLQIAGAGGYLFSANLTAGALKEIAYSILRSGTTSFLIVLPTNSHDIYPRAIATVRDNPQPGLLGLHLEGPFISTEKRGAHPVEFIRTPSREDVDALLAGSEGIVRMVTLAPEKCSGEIIRLISEKGIVVCAGHSNASFSQATEGFSNGIGAVTHLFNAMSSIHHRDPGLPGAAFLSGNVHASIVADGIHVDFKTLMIAKRIMQERLYLVSDAVEESKAGALRHIRKNDRFILPDGTLSGSALTMLTAVRNCTDKAGIPLDESLRMASTYPAKVMGIENRGMIRPGYKADILVFTKVFTPYVVISEGNIIS